MNSKIIIIAYHSYAKVLIIDEILLANMFKSS
jgi:hypothetical protein